MRARLVEGSPCRMEWQIVSEKTVPPSYRDRCLKPTAGCLLQWSANRACVVPTRTPPSYQLSRANARGLAKKSYSKNKISIHVKLLMDNLTAINKMGGLSSIPASLVFDICSSGAFKGKFPSLHNTYQVSKIQQQTTNPG